MYLSHLLIDTGGNPDRVRPGRKWLDNVYNVHRRLCMAFPFDFRKQQDPEFVQPLDPQHWHPRQFLFRIDNNIDGDSQRAVIIVQSRLKPDWDYCFQNAPDFLAAIPETKPYEPVFQSGQQLRFRIRVNVSVKTNVVEKEVVEGERKPTGNTLHKRVSLTWDRSLTPQDAVSAWFAAKSEKLGFTPHRCELVNLGWVYGSKPTAKGEAPKRENEYHPLRFRSALLEGLLRVDDPTAFLQAVTGGIGSAKGMGFGLLSVIPARDAH